MSFMRSYQFVRRDRQIAHAFSSRIKDCVRDSGWRADDADFTNTPCAEVWHVRVRFIDEVDIEFWCVRVHSDVVFGEIGIHDAPRLLIGDCRFHQGRSETEQHSADDLAPREKWIDHPSHIVNSYRAFYAHLSENVDVHLDENCAVRKEGIFFALLLVWF